jgi:hypothetical protein
MAENEVRFRALNERLRKGSDTWGPGDGVLELVCECADEDCTRSITLTPRGYESVRGDETQFLVVPGHQRIEVEDVVAERGRLVRRQETRRSGGDRGGRRPAGLGGRRPRRRHVAAAGPGAARARARA